MNLSRNYSMMRVASGISEGQLFFLYKRLNAAIVNDKGTLRPMTLQESMFPVPADIK